MKNIFTKTLISCTSILALISLCGCGDQVTSVNPSSSPLSEITTSEENSNIITTSENIDTSKPIATFYYNYEGAPSDIYTKVNFESGARIKMPGDPIREGYLFSGWAKDSAGSSIFDVKTRLDASIDLYATWTKAYTFEAEYVDFSGKAGMGYSANVEETQMICKDNGTANASNGYYVSYLYYNGANLEFDITSDVATTGVTFVARLSSEFYDVLLEDTNFKFIVNDSELSGFPCDLSGALDVSSGANKRPFTNFTISKDVSLNAGLNKIILKVNNTNAHGGTMYADAPIVDCIYLGTSANLTWEPHLNNID